MSLTPLTTGEHLLIFPQDVTGKVDSAFYGVVVSTARPSVRVESVADTTPGVYVQSKTVAVKRRVPNEGGLGSQPGLWMRRDVCVLSRNYHYYDQVVRQDGTCLGIATHLGIKTCSLQQVIEEVYVILGAQRWPTRHRAPREVHDRLLDSILVGDEGMSLATSRLHEIVLGLKDRQEAAMEWVDPATGSTHTTLLERLIRYVFCVDGKRDIPANIRHQVGNHYVTSQLLNPLIHRRQMGRRAFSTHGKNMTLRAGENEVPAAVYLGRQWLAQPRCLWAVRRWPRPRTPRHDLLDNRWSKRNQRPKKQPAQLHDYNAAPMLKRNRCGFNPTTEQERIHLAVANEQHKCKSGDGYIDYVLSVAKFVAHTGVASIVYDLTFGNHGLSIMHFKRIGFLDRLRALAPGTVTPQITKLPPHGPRFHGPRPT
ncbi:hypothetical protein PHMEG_00020655 [Phytophthora megakarya]|uniref:Uncharacterized protein n=1 Tax=Phytophthora megakarya TaxID=4795 RepID=A0A225VN96_9STRA|nr:hypothetical protein PHMEG_00020655 [Phytophthora megakarya]